MKSIEQYMKSMQELRGHKSVVFKDLCMFPNVHLPLGFKTPKFDKFDGMVYRPRNLPLAHLDDMAQDFVRQFQYNVYIMPGRNTVSNMRKKSNESFREYAIKLREQAARVKPPLDEQELADIFIEAQDPEYFHHLTAAMGRPFHTTIKIGEMVESGLKTGRIGQSSYPQHYYPYVPQYQVYPSPYTVFNAQSYVHPPTCPHFRDPTQGNLRPQRPPYQVPYNPPPMQNYAQEQGQKRKFTPLGKSYSSLFQKLRKIGVIGSIPPHRLNPTAPGFQANERSQNNLMGMICDDQEYKLLGKMEKLFRKIGEEDNSINSSEPVASLDVEGVNLDTKVLCVLRVSNETEVLA
ncbi:hypothetical protein MTR67_011649, partial [Solanum verrucosum]